MAKEKPPTFEEFADTMNARARHANMLAGLGVHQGRVVDDPRALARSRIERTLTQSETDPNHYAPLRDTLMARLDDLFREPEKGRFASMIDVVTTGLVDDDAILHILKNSGVDLSTPHGLSYAVEVFSEAADYYDKCLHRPDKISKLNPALRVTRTKPKDLILEIFRTAAGKGRRILIPQACALLRIAFVIDILNSDMTLKYLSDVQAELKKFKGKYVRRAEKTRQPQIYTQHPDDMPLPLIRYEARMKDRFSAVTKLLHEPKNQAGEVIDHCGFRFTTHRPIDTIRLIYMLFFHPKRSFFSPYSILINEVKNVYFSEETLLQILGDEALAEEIVSSFSIPTMDDAELVTVDSMSAQDNSFSAKSYKAIHISFYISVIAADGIRTKIPVEVQIVDEQTNIENWKHALHDDYKGRQRDAVALRVLGRNNLQVEYEKLYGHAKAKKDDK